MTSSCRLFSLALLVLCGALALPAHSDVRPPRASKAVRTAAVAAAPDASGRYVVDLLVLYTPLLEQRVAGTQDIAAEAQRLVSVANGYFDNSDMAIAYRIVGVSRYAGAPEADDFYVNQQTLADDAGVRALRDQAGADLVVLLRTNDEHAGFCGLSILFNDGDQTDPPANVDPERDAFIVIASGPSESGAACIQLEQLFAHELGHALGGGHQVNVPSIGTPYLVEFNTSWKPYGHAWACGLQPAVTSNYATATNYTIMFGNMGATGESPFFLAGTPRSDVFSSPQISIDGLVCGFDLPGVGADNRRSILEAAPYVAAYRNSKAGSSGGGSATGGESGGGAFGLGASLMLLALALRRARRTGIAAATLGLAACGGGGGYGDDGGGPNPQFFCESLSGGGTQVTTSSDCLGCSFSNPARAADGDLATYATESNPLGETMTIRATAQSGIVYPAGRQPGVMFYTASNSANNLLLRTYLGGVLQETSTCPDLTRCRVEGRAGGNPYSYISFYAGTTFDAVELVSSGTETLQVHEICHNGNAD